MSLLSRAFGVRPHRAQAVGVRRDLVIPAGDGVPLLANRFIRWTSTGPRWCCSAARARRRSINVSDGIVRLTNAAPDTPQPVELDLSSVAHAFRRGHRIRLQVSGGAHPRYGRNLGTAEPFATSTRLQASDRTVLHDAEHPSAVWLPVHG